MHHVDLSRSTASTPVIHPWEYVAMRRNAAGLSVEQLAQALGGRVYERHLRAIETPGLRFQQLADLTRALPFSTAVYRQLADLPPHLHPRLCHRCGWDSHTDQPDGHDGLTTWSLANGDMCTRCDQAEQH